MLGLIKNDIESELSYAYLHAVASSAGASCKVGNRHEDNHGIDATLTAWNIGPSSDEIDLKVQLKATKSPQIIKNNKISYFLRDNEDSKRYNELRKNTVNVHRIMVVLFLPEEESEWLNINPDSLIIKNAAYWVSLRGAPSPAGNENGQTIYIPDKQLFTPKGLIEIFRQISRKKYLQYIS